MMFNHLQGRKHRENLNKYPLKVAEYELALDSGATVPPSTEIIDQAVRCGMVSIHIKKNQEKYNYCNLCNTGSSELISFNEHLLVGMQHKENLLQNPSMAEEYERARTEPILMVEKKSVE